MTGRYLQRLGAPLLSRACLGTSSSMSKRPALVSHIEVERKFQPTSQLKLRLRLEGKVEQCNHGLPKVENVPGGETYPQSVLRFLRLPDKLIRDTYYDLNDQLASKGIWIRSRNCAVPNSDALPVISRRYSAKLEAKVRLEGDYANSQFHEIEGESNIRLLLGKHLPGVKMEDLSIMAGLETHRKSWIVHQLGESTLKQEVEETSRTDEVFIVLDGVTEPHACRNVTLPFKHQVGEVEMTREVVGGTDEQDHESMRRKEAERMDLLIEEFMIRHSDLFPRSPKPKGKLSAYFEWLEKNFSPNPESV